MLVASHAEGDDMNERRRTALVTAADHRWGRWAAEALVDLGDAVTVTAEQGGFTLPGAETAQLDPSDEEGWQRVAASFATCPDIVVIGCAPRPSVSLEDIDAAVFRELARSGIVAPWLALKHVLALARPDRLPTILLLDPSADAGVGGYPLHDAETAALRHMVAATLHDAMQLGVRPRSNRLVFSQEGADEASFKEAVRVLADDRSRFMTGAELVLGQVFA